MGKELSLDALLAADADRFAAARADLWRAYRAILGRGVRVAVDGQSRRFDASQFSPDDLAALGRIEARLGLAEKDRRRLGEALARYEQALIDASRYEKIVQEFAAEERAIEAESNRLGPMKDALARRIQALVGRQAELGAAASGQVCALQLREEFSQLFPEREYVPGPIPAQKENGSKRASGARLP